MARQVHGPPRKDGKDWWNVYCELRAQMEPPEEPHLLVDSSQPFGAVIDLLEVLLYPILSSSTDQMVIGNRGSTGDRTE
jgi:hypothetical protein